MQADADSLSRMLISFVQSRGRILSAQEIEVLRQQALEGDLKSVM